MKKIFFKSQEDIIAGNLFLPENIQNPPGVLLFYGGKKTGTKALFTQLQKLLQKKSFASLAIDFPGVGESSGELKDGSLATRIRYANAAYKEFTKYVDINRIAVYGGSMGGYIASQVVAKYSKTKLLLLLAPAAYGKDAENLPLNEKFTQAISKKNSWRDSQSFSDVQHFHGKIFLAFGEYDTVIPKEIQSIYTNLVQGKGKIAIIPNATHRLFASKLLIIEFLQKNL